MEGDPIDAFEQRDRSNINDIQSVLNKIGLARYTDALNALGWDRISDLQVQSRAQLEAIAKSAGMLPGHAYRFSTALEKGPTKESTIKNKQPSNNKQPFRRPTPSLTSRLAASTREGAIRAAAARYAQATHTARQANSSFSPPRHAAAPDSQCGIQAGGAPAASAFQFKPMSDGILPGRVSGSESSASGGSSGGARGCITSAAEFAQRLASIGPWPSAWSEQQPDAIQAYSQLQALPLRVGGGVGEEVGGSGRCSVATLRGTPVATLLSPVSWDRTKCFWVGAMQRSTLLASRDVAACTRDCHICSIRPLSAPSKPAVTSSRASASQSSFRCQHGQPQAWLLPPSHWAAPWQTAPPPPSPPPPPPSPSPLPLPSPPSLPSSFASAAASRAASIVAPTSTSTSTSTSPSPPSSWLWGWLGGRRRLRGTTSSTASTIAAASTIASAIASARLAPFACSRLPTEAQLHSRLPSLSPLLPLRRPSLPTSTRTATSPTSRGAFTRTLAAPPAATNWCGNVSGVGSWSLEGRSRYLTWPQLSGAPFLSAGSLR